MRFPLLAPLLILVACAPEADPPAGGETAVAPREATAPAPIAEPDSAAPAVPEPVSNGSAPTLELSIPQAIRGRWRESEGDSVTATQCAPANYEDAIRTLDIRADGFTQFETGGRLISVAERGPTCIRATFDTTYADEPTQGEYVFDVRDGGQTLIVRGLAANGRSVRHRRCPS